MNIENILNKMSLKEKIEQLNQLFLTKDSIDEIKERLKNEFNRNVYILDDEKDMDDLSNRCLTYFVGEE